MVTELGVKINPRRDKVFYHEKQVVILDDEKIYIVLNKPKNFITTASDEKGRATVFDLVRTKHRVFPVGRLDRNTTGVLLLTNDGELANRLMHPKYEFPKAYQVEIEPSLSDEHAGLLAKGIQLEDGITSPAEIIILPKSHRKSIGVVVHEGRNRMVRRMFEKLKYEVKKLDRVAYGDITLQNLPRGSTRSLTKQEVRKLRAMVGLGLDE